VSANPYSGTYNVGEVAPPTALLEDMRGRAPVCVSTGKKENGELRRAGTVARRGQANRLGAEELRRTERGIPWPRAGQ
jgi:hypothetical protein